MNPTSTIRSLSARTSVGSTAVQKDFLNAKISKKCYLIAGIPLLVLFSAIGIHELILTPDPSSVRLLFWGGACACALATAWFTARRLRSDLADSVSVLHDRVASRERKLEEVRHLERERTRDAARGALQARSRIMADLSHSIRTHMHGIMGMTDLVIDAGLDGKQREDLETAKASADALMCVINNLFDYTMIEAGKLALDSTGFRLRQRLDDRSRAWSTQAARKRLKYDCHVQPDVPDRLAGDANRLMQVLANLVNNSVKFTGRGRVDVYVKKEKSRRDDVVLRFSVIDTGDGMSPGRRNAILDLLSRDDDAAARPPNGVGIGLLVSSRIVALMGGRIWFETEEGGGAAFHFTARFGLPEKTGETCISARTFASG